MSSLIFCYVKQFHELWNPRACRHSQTHLRRAKQCSNMLMNLEAAFVMWHPWVIPSPGKYRVDSSVEISCSQCDHDALTSVIFLLFQNLEYLIKAALSRAVPHRFTVSHGRRTQPAALIWQKNGHCKVALGGHPIPLRGNGLWGTISQWYCVLSASAVRPTEMLRCVGTLYFPPKHRMKNQFWKLYGKMKRANCCLRLPFM